MLDLPKNKNGRPYLSYSQVKSWQSEDSFNLKTIGKYEYFIQYFFGEKFKDVGWGEFGHDVENYITLKQGVENFTKEEIQTLDKISPLGVFQKEIIVDFGEFDLLMYLDDCTEDFTRIRDYKTASKNSVKQYYSEEYKQIQVYSLGVLETYGFMPSCELVAIERKGNCFYGKGRKNLFVGTEIWYIPIIVTLAQIEELKQNIINTAKEISSYYSLYKILNNVN